MLDIDLSKRTKKKEEIIWYPNHLYGLFDAGWQTICRGEFIFNIRHCQLTNNKKTRFSII